MRMLMTVTTTAALALAAQANAGTLFYNGNLGQGDLTFHHPNASAVGSGVQFYEVQQITVDATGNYTFEAASPNTTGTPSNALDTFLAVYTGSFNPGAPGAGTFNDDFTGVFTVLPGPFLGTVAPAGTGFTGAQPASRLASVALTAGTNYFVVITSFRDTTFVGTGTTAQASGNYFIGISGPGNIVPTPGAAALLGLGGLIAARRRRA
jgi:MYXO-CTERM domain-containing protein